MTSNISSEEWLKQNIESGSIRFYHFDVFMDVKDIGTGGYGKVRKAMLRPLGRMVAFKVLQSCSHDKDVMFENFVNEVSNQTRSILEYCYYFT